MAVRGFFNQVADLFRIIAATGEQLLTFTAGGYLGIGTSSPYARLSVAGPVVAESYTATSTTATSTFAGGLEANLLNITSSEATSSFSNGIQLTNGCFRLPSGECAGAGSGSAQNCGKKHRAENTDEPFHLSFLFPSERKV